MSKVCTDECEHCIYIGEGDFICDLNQAIVIEDWFPLPVEENCEKCKGFKK